MYRFKKAISMMLCLMLLTTAIAEIAWPTSLTSGQARLRSYVEDVNLTLTQLGDTLITIATQRSICAPQKE